MFIRTKPPACRHLLPCRRRPAPSLSINNSGDKTRARRIYLPAEPRAWRAGALHPMPVCNTGSASPLKPSARQEWVPVRSNSTASRQPPTEALRAFNKVTARHCFMCLARDHRATACRDPIRCFRCRRSGHTERNCKAPRPYASVHHRPAARKPLQPHQQPHQPSPPQPTPHSPNPLPPQSLPLPPPPPLPPTKTKTTGATPMAIGEPHTCPEVETVFVSNSFQLEHDARDWESCTLVPWALHLPLHAGAQDITDLITRELHLQPGECSLTHALGFRIFYRVRLYLDGIPKKTIRRSSATSRRQSATRGASLHYVGATNGVVGWLTALHQMHSHASPPACRRRRGNRRGGKMVMVGGSTAVLAANGALVTTTAPGASPMFPMTRGTGSVAADHTHY
uniref:CCHC-type domain-containing protein n=1 Tax=Setaria viridis TaxID=4556 RepID=A0A4U6TI64_SETVI|nr:hypothetical protein SEVIR_8G220100v2 [Setaria viridis]